jgi:hypothetical protein
MGMAALLDAQVVVGADAGERGQFFAAKPFDAPAWARDEPGIFWPDPAASQFQVLAECVPAGHDHSVAKGGFASTQDQPDVPKILLAVQDSMVSAPKWAQRRRRAVR